MTTQSLLTFDGTTVKEMGAGETFPVANMPEMGAASIDTAGSAGAVPAPQMGDHQKFLRGDRTWGDPPASSEISYVTAESRFFSLF